MYPHPSMNAEIARQHQAALLREARAERMASKPEEPETPEIGWVTHVADALQLHVLGHVKRPTLGTR